MGPEHDTSKKLSSKTELFASIETPHTEDEFPLPINGLMFPVDMEDKRVVGAFKDVVTDVVNKVGGLQPKIETLQVQRPVIGDLVPRLIASFEVDTLSEDQIAQLEEIARRAYSDDVRTTKTKQGKPAALCLYTKPEAVGKEKPTVDTTVGWYLGLTNGNPDRTSKGIYVQRKIGKKDIASGVKAREDSEWFTQKMLYNNSGKKYSGGSYLIEIREGGMYFGGNGRVVDGPYQTDLAETIVYTSLVLAGKELPPHKPGLTYDIYHTMNQIGLGSATDLPGLEEQIESVERSLIIPLASPDLTRSLRGNPKSVGLIGQVGTGKTQVIKSFLRQDLGVIMVPVNAHDFAAEIGKPPEKRTILPRIRDVSNKVGKNVVLVIEDLENIAHKDNPGNKLLLNELAGLYNSGYRVLWTTNHPEDFNPQLLEPERLGGKLIFCGLPTYEARQLIIHQHLVQESRTKKLPIFDPSLISSEVSSSEEARVRIIEAVAASTDGFTPRYLKDIVVEAIDQFMFRISRSEGRVDGLGESNLENRSFTVDDWRYALNAVCDVYDVQARKAEDERLKKLVKPGNEGKKAPMSLTYTNGHNGSHPSIDAVLGSHGLIYQDKDK